MAQWTFRAYVARLDHEAKHATNPRGMVRLKTTLIDVERFLDETIRDQDEEGWCALLSAYERAATVAGMQHEYPSGMSIATATGGR